LMVIFLNFYLKNHAHLKVKRWFNA
jgi:hypothetical protein